MAGKIAKEGIAVKFVGILVLFVLVVVLKTRTSPPLPLCVLRFLL